MENCTSSDQRKASLISNLLSMNPEVVRSRNIINMINEAKREIEIVCAQREQTLTVEKIADVLEKTAVEFMEVESYLETYKLKKIFHDPPLLREIPERLQGAENANDMLQMQGKRFVVRGYLELGKHLMDNAEQRGILTRPDCEDCIGECFVQRSRTSTICFGNDSPFDCDLIVPCITKETKKLQKYVVNDLKYVSYFYSF